MALWGINPTDGDDHPSLHQTCGRSCAGGNVALKTSAITRFYLLGLLAIGCTCNSNTPNANTPNSTTQAAVFLDETKVVPAKMEWNRDFTSGRGGEVSFRVVSQQPFTFSIVTEAGHQALVDGGPLPQQSVVAMIESQELHLERSVTVPPGSVWLIIQNRGDEASEVRLQCAVGALPPVPDSGQLVSHTSSLDRGDASTPTEITVHGRIVGPDGRPLRDAPLSLTVSTPNPATSKVLADIAYHKFAVSRTDGSFEFVGVPVGTLSLCYPGGARSAIFNFDWDRWKDGEEEFPTAPTKDICWVRVMCNQRGDFSENVLVDLSQCRSVIEGVVRGVGELPLADVEVIPYWSIEECGVLTPVLFHGGPLPKVKTDSEGRYRIQGLPPIDCGIMFRKGRASSAGPVPVHYGETTVHNGRL